MDLRSLDNDSDETYPNVWTKAELHTGLVQVHKMNPSVLCSGAAFISREK